jgi:hypothetical protein
MNIHYVYTKTKFNGHQTLILAQNIPHWFERIFLARELEHKTYVGHRTKWFEKHNGNLTPVTRAIAAKLEIIENGIIEERSLHAQKGKTMNSKAII